MGKLKHIIRHEFRLTTANKAFVILTIIGPFLIFAITVLPTLLAQSSSPVASDKPLALFGAPPRVEQAISAAFSGMKLQVEHVEDIEAAKASVIDGSRVALLELEAGWPDTGKAIWYSKSSAEIGLYSTASAVLEAVAREERIRESGIDPALAAKLLSKPTFEVIKLEKGGEEKAQGQGDQAFLETLMTVLVFIMLLYMTILLYGQMIGRSVVTEKTSKTVEIMLSSVTSRDLMIGKILGLGLAGMLQYAVWISMAFVLNHFLGPLFGLALPVAVSMQNMMWLFVFFILGFFLYSSAYAALGAASEDEQHLGQIAWPLLMFLIIPMVMLNTLVTSPDSTAVVIMSFFPLTSPIVMLSRILVASPPVWHLVLCIGILVASIVGMMVFAGKVFRVGILMTAKRPKLKEVLRWVKVK
ncbi:MAG: ABC transporter permease [Rectinema sp.]